MSGESNAGGCMGLKFSDGPEDAATWDAAQVGDRMVFGSGVSCGFLGDDGLACTRDEGHDVQHVATGFGIVLAVWPVVA